MDEHKRLKQREARRRRQRRALIIKSVILAALIVVLILAVMYVTGFFKTDDKVQNSSSVNTQSTQNPDDQTSDTSDTSSNSITDTATLISQAEALAVQYDYDGAIALLSSVENYDKNADIVSLLADYETKKSNLVATPATQVTHVFFHSLVVDPARGFSLKGEEAWDRATIGFCEWMTTVDEFNAMMNQMYERGYVLVRLEDLITKTVDENGTMHITQNNIYLPEGKIPFVLSLDDLSYYHSYDGRGIATKMIVGEDGTPTCEYVDASGNTLVGSYDCVPLLDDFLEQHPDFSYKGAKGTIALTGYNGILGYRTDYCYRDRVDLTADQQAWLDANPNFNWDEECAKAKEVADCIKADGWTFASHTWGHIRVGETPLDKLQVDTEKWLNYVKPLIGDCDTIIFAHGQDLAAWNEDYASSPKFQYLKSQGFNVFCNVDSSQYFVQIEDSFLRMGRRNLDGYRLWREVYAGDNNLSDLFDASTVIDPLRPTDPSLYAL